VLLAAKLVLPAAKLVQSSLPRVLNPAKARRRLPFLRRSLVVALLEKSGDDLCILQGHSPALGATSSCEGFAFALWRVGSCILSRTLL